MSRQLQLAVVGATGVGKTSLLRRLGASSELSPRPAPADTYVPSVGVELFKVTLTGGGSRGPVALDLFDTPGEERWRALCDGYVSRAHGLVVVVEVVRSDDRAASAAQQVHGWDAARSWLGRSLPTLLLAVRTQGGPAGPEVVWEELPRADGHAQSLQSQAWALGAGYAEVNHSSGVGLEAALLGLTAAIDAERSTGSPRPGKPPPTRSSESMNDTADVQKLVAGIGGVLDSSADSIDAASPTEQRLEGGREEEDEQEEENKKPKLAVPTRANVVFGFEQHAGADSQMTNKQFLALARELWPDAEGLVDTVQHAVAAAAATWPLEYQGCKSLLQLVADIDQLGTTVGRRHGALPTQLSVGDFTAGVRAAGQLISDEEAVGAFVGLGGAGGYADVEEAIWWLAKECWSQQKEDLLEETLASGSPVMSPHDREQERARRQEELLARIEADPDNMELLAELQQLHRSLSTELGEEPEPAAATDNIAALDALIASEDQLRGLIHTAKLLEEGVEDGSQSPGMTSAGQRRTSWADGGAAAQAAAEAEASAVGGKQRSPPSRMKRSLFSRARSNSRSRPNAAGSPAVPSPSPSAVTGQPFPRLSDDGENTGSAPIATGVPGMFLTDCLRVFSVRGAGSDVPDRWEPSASLAYSEVRLWRVEP